MRVFRFFQRESWDRERSQEIEAHLRMEEDELISRGVPREEARYAARRKLGNPTAIREEIYEMNTIGFFETLGQDLKYALRLLRLSPGFTLVAVLSLALGIGANTAIFQLLDAVRLRSLPVNNPQELYEVRIVAPHGRSGAFVNRYPRMTRYIWDEIRKRQQAFSAVFAWGDWGFNLGKGGKVRRAESIWVSGDYFQALQVRPLAGRLISEQDDQPGCAPIAVISYAFWKSEFAGAPSAIGSTLSLDSHPAEIIGVTPASFTGIDVGHRFDVAVPICAALAITGKGSNLEQKWGWWLSVIGRLKPGWTVERANAHLQALAKPVFEAALPETYDAKRKETFLSNSLRLESVATGLSDLRETYQDPLWLLISIAAVVLLIACANLANLLLARATARQKEVAVRMALGASRGRLVRQLLAESLLLSLIGAGCGVALAAALSRGLVAFLTTSQQAIFLDLRLNLPVLTFAAGLAILTCILFGWVPALRATSIAPAAAIKSGGRGVTAARERFTLQRVLVATQVALSLALLFSALLFVRTFQKLSTLNAGFRSTGVLIASLDPRHTAAGPSPALDRQLFESIRTAPAVDLAARAENFPMSGGWSNDDVTVDERSGEGKTKISYFSRVSPGFFALMHIPMLAGRDFAESDTASSPRVAIVNEAFVREMLGGGIGLGRTFTKRDGVGQNKTISFEIVGIVGDMKVTSLRDDTGPIAFVPDTQMWGPQLAETVVIRSDAPLHDVMASVLGAVATVNPEVNVEFTAFQTQIEETLIPEKLMATLSGFFGLLAAVLAVVGLYGVIAYMVAQRTNEIGIRIAMGATRGRILSLILKGAGWVIAVGLLVGTALSLAASRAAHSLLYGLHPYDPSTLITAILLLLGVSLLAATLPARRAARLEPMRALREE